MSLLLCCAAVPLAQVLVPSAAVAKGSHSVRYQCPMHPGVVQEGQGDCPICGMKLVQVHGQEHAGAAPGNAPAISLSSSQRDVLGITVGRAERTEANRLLRVLGRVVPDETRLHRLTSGVEGSIRDLSPATAGSHVRKGQVLGSFYAPAALTTIQIYLLNVAGHGRAAQKKSEGSLDGENLELVNANLQQRRMQFENLGISAQQREEIARTRKVPDTIQIVAPVDGFVLARNLAPGLRFERGMELYRIADLRRVWVVGDVFPEDAPFVRPGMPARVELVEQRISLPATVADVLPQFDAVSRTLKVRVVVDNPGFVLRPDMFVDVRLAAATPPALTVPANAVVDSGLSRTVFVETAPGVFEPRKVETGLRSGDRIEITSGLTEGQPIATSGVFFLDSETRMKAAASGTIASLTGAPAPNGHEKLSSDGAGPSHPAAGKNAQTQGAVAPRAVGLR
ncbi:MAG TPA: efflux RND transporter periplasmic adaptor subunit [Myxococcales bacterium]|nr:efflux RND transporter periplasmic adaptor subunit [Myxococcales bacterium]